MMQILEIIDIMKPILQVHFDNVDIEHRRPNPYLGEDLLDFGLTKQGRIKYRTLRVSELKQLKDEGALRAETVKFCESLKQNDE